MVPCALRDKAVLLRSEDDVAIAKAEICVGTRLEDDGGVIEAREDLRPGHKIARRSIAVGQPLRRYGQVIGFATQDIARGDHVHTHNLAIGELQREYEVGTDVRPVDYYPPSEMRSFEAYRRGGGAGGGAWAAGLNLRPKANEAPGTREPISELILATNCGGSDGNSGITANPALGWAVDELVRYGGTGVLAETPEIYGAEHLLIRRAVNQGVAKKLIDRYTWWEWYCRGIEAMDNNPAPGNKAGGLTTVFAQTLGGVAKGGTRS